MESLPKKIPHNKVPALVLVLLALAVMVFVIWRVDSAPLDKRCLCIRRHY
ncbi:multidrug resistance protein MdtN [Salmonella enterica subsp. arizonae]|nr:multidrug resistance protein MdtN [Salmonella enterica subsp. arizonae]